MSETTDLYVRLINGVRVIQFNRPAKKNAITYEMFSTMTNVLNNDANDDKVKLCVITGTGDYFSSGNDRKSHEEKLAAQAKGNAKEVEQKRNIVNDFVTALIDYPKLLIAVVNGPALGSAVTILGLFDIVYAAEWATFQTPFAKLGMCPEACSSYTFPLIMGKSKANEMLFLNCKLSAKEAHRIGFVSEILNKSQMHQMWKKIYKTYSGIPLYAILITKRLMRKCELEKLHQVHAAEMAQLQECHKSDLFEKQLRLFMSKKSKL